jgi:flavodoxin I
MKDMKTALVYSFNSQHTSKVAEVIKEHIKGKFAEVNIETASFDELLKYDFLIMGVSTWFDGELPNYWDEYLPGIEEQNFSKKKVALFGLGNQAGYPENYQDAMGILADFFSKRGAEITGHTSAGGYKFEGSAAVKNGMFCGLAIDSSFAAKKVSKIVNEWLQSIQIPDK